VLEQTVSSSSSEALTERKLRPALQPKIEIQSFADGKDLEYTMAVELMPEIEPVDFSALSLERLKPDVPDAEIVKALERLAERYKKSEPVTEARPAAAGDSVVIDFVGSVGGEKFAGGEGKDHTLELGSGSFIPGFEDQLIGTKVGDHVAVKVTFPDPYASPDLAGKEAVFEVDVKELRSAAPLEIDDSLADAVGMENLEELKTAIREQLERDYAGVARQKLKRDLLDQLAERHSFGVPPGMVDLEFEGIWKQFEAERDRAKQQGGDALAEIEEGGKSDDEFKTEYRSIAERRVRLGLLLAEVGRINNIEVTQDELNKAAMAQARQYPGQEKAVIDYFRNNPDAMGSLRAPIYEDKVVDFVLEMATVAEKSVSPEALMRAAGMAGDDAEEATPSAAEKPKRKTAKKPAAKS
jgi:trigger factor